MSHSHYAQLGLAFAVGVALSAGYVALGSLSAPDAAPAIVVIEDRCDDPPPTEPGIVDAAPGAGAPGAVVPAYGLDQATLEQLARHCEVRDDVPEALDDATAAALGLTQAEREAYEVALARRTGADAATEFGLLHALAPDEDLPDEPAALRLALRQRVGETKTSYDRSLHRRMAEERAGLRELRPNPNATTWAEFERFRLGHGDRFAAELAEALGPARVDELRRKQRGWPGKRIRVTGCEDVPLPRKGSLAIEPDPGELDPAIIERVIAAHGSEIRACYEIGLADDPELSGDLRVRFQISAAGEVEGARVEDDSTVAHELVQTCAAQAVRRWRFPKPEGGAVEVKYGFALTPSE